MTIAQQIIYANKLGAKPSKLLEEIKLKAIGYRIYGNFNFFIAKLDDNSRIHVSLYENSLDILESISFAKREFDFLNSVSDVEEALSSKDFNKMAFIDGKIKIHFCDNSSLFLNRKTLKPLTYDESVYNTDRDFFPHSELALEEMIKKFDYE